MDIVDPKTRSRMMAAIKGKDTKPEYLVRRVAHALGYRFRLHRRDLPGSPDLVFPRLRAVILVHGCFWHRHAGCRYAYNPKSNTEFWETKFRDNVKRDQRALFDLARLGWASLVVWECETRDRDRLRDRIAKHLGERSADDGDETGSSSDQA